MFLDQRFIRGRVLLSYDLGFVEIVFHSGALDFSRLFRYVPLGHQDQAMAGGKILQRLRDLRQKLDGMVFNGTRKTGDLRMQIWRDWIEAEPFKCVNQRVSEAVQAVTMLHNAFSLDIVENFADLLGRKFVMIQERDKLRDGTLEVDIIFPER